MDRAPTHIIRRQILELRGVRETDARQLQKELGELFREKILPLLDRYMSAHSPGGVTHRIDRLELDLGTVYRNRLDDDLIKKIARELEAYFQPQPSSGPHFKTAREEISEEKTHLEIFTFFVETGNLPWWADLDSGAIDPVERSLDFLLREEESALRDLMHKWVREPAALKRIVLQTGFPKWAELAATNMDRTGKELTAMLSEVRDLLRKITPWSEYPAHKLHEILGLKFLPWVFMSSQKAQNTAEFWNGFLIPLTAGRPTEYGELFDELFLRFEKNKQEEADPATFLPKEKRERANLQAKIIQRIERLLEVKALAAEKKIEWLGYLQKLNDQPLQSEDLAAIVRLLEREAATENTENVRESHKEKVSDAREISELSETEKDRFSEADELLVGNAGLVILSPFLHRFFENLNLLEDRRFANEAAAHRAAGLLQFLADGREIPAEHRCGLNKILCGLEAETVLEFGEPVTAEEAEACQDLLEAAIAHAPILGEMSVEGFRGSFLIRKGILRAGFGAWHLNVERETFDVVLERFPWNWSVVKLPWMKWAISVDWI